MAGLDNTEGGTSDELKNLPDEEPRTDFWDTPTCQRCLSCFRPELAAPLPNEPQSPAIDAPEGPVVLHNSPSDLATRLTAGCWWCTRVFIYIQRWVGTTSIEDFSRRYPNFHSTFPSSDESGVSLPPYVFIQLNDDQNDACYFTRYDWTWSSRGFVLDKESANQQTTAGTPFPRCMYQLNEADSNTGSQRSMQCIATQINNCRRTHESCGSLSDSTWYPRRLLHILSAGDGSITALRVVETRDDKAVNGPYATLSYCWGGKLNLRLLTNSYEEFTNVGIPAAQIPQLFIDAAFVASKLGASYIWIDALCIIQDSANDWLQESATMHLVYENGLCNIIAASAAHSEEPMFRTRDTRLIAPCIIRGRDSRTITTYSTSADNELLENHWWFTALGFLPVYQRGWILQERLLATRTVIFTQDNIYFQCASGTTRDIFPHHLLSKPTAMGSDTDIKDFTYDNCFRKWYGVVNAYGNTDLSYQKDTFIAISGLAEKINQLHPSRYLNGLWEADLVKGLCWTDFRSERRLGFSAPSWSWASVSRPFYPTDEPHPYDREISKALVTENEDKLQLRGPMFFIRSDAPSPLDEARIDEVIRQRMALLSGHDSYHIVDLDGSDKEREEQPLPGTLLCLPLHYNGRWRSWDALLLANVTGAWGVYRRVGKVQICIEAREESPSQYASEGGALEPQDEGGVRESREEVEDYHARLLALSTCRPEDIYHHDYDEVTKEHMVFLV